MRSNSNPRQTTAQWTIVIALLAAIPLTTFEQTRLAPSSISSRASVGGVQAKITANSANPINVDGKNFAAKEARSIAGIVLNSLTGAHVAHATVSILSPEAGRMLQTTLSDEQGHFSFAPLPAGKYQLTVSKRGYRTAFYDEHDDFSSALVIGTKTGSEAFVDIGQLSFRLTPEARLHGLITADGGEAVEGATVRLFQRSQDRGLGRRTVSAETTTTDDTGAYEFTNLGPGDYLIAITARPWYALPANPSRAKASGIDPGAALDVAYPITYYESTTDEARAIPLSLASGSEQQANITLNAVPAVYLTVDTPSTQDDPTADTSTAGPSHTATLHQFVFGTEIPTESRSTQDAASGTVQFNGVAPGAYELEMGSPQRIIALEATYSQRVDVGAGSPVGSVRGSLRSETGRQISEPVNLALVQVEAAARHDPVQTVSSAGRFQFPSVPPGHWTLWAALGDEPLPVIAVGVNGTFHAGNEIHAGNETHAGNDLTVPEGPIEVTVTLSDNPAPVTGIVTKTGKGFPGAMVVLVPRIPAAYRALVRRDQSDSDGSFSLRNVPPGEYTVVAIEDGWTLDWAHPQSLRRYLSNGVAVTVPSISARSNSETTSDGPRDKATQEIQLTAPVRVQQR